MAIFAYPNHTCQHCNQGFILQVEMLLILASLTNRTLVMPGHMDASIDHMRGVALVTDFWDFDHMQGFIDIIGMQDYLDRRYAELGQLVVYLYTQYQKPRSICISLYI